MLLASSPSLLLLLLPLAHALPYIHLPALPTVPLQRRVPYNVVNVDGGSGASAGGSGSGSGEGSSNPQTPDVTTVVSVSISTVDEITTIVTTALPSTRTVDVSITATATAIATVTSKPKVEIVNAEGPNPSLQSPKSAHNTTTFSAAMTIQSTVEVAPIQYLTSSSAVPSITTISSSTVSSFSQTPFVSSSSSHSFISTMQSIIEVAPEPLPTASPTSDFTTASSTSTYSILSLNGGAPTSLVIAAPASSVEPVAAAVTPQWPEAAEYQPLPSTSTISIDPIPTTKSKTFNDGKWRTSYPTWNITSTSTSISYHTTAGPGARKFL